LPAYNTRELQLLLGKAIQYHTSHQSALNQLHWFYRDKTHEYFLDVIKLERGMMTPYIKDLHGDPRSPINDRINGLFFTADSVVDPKTNQPKKISIYGRLRFLVPSSAMINGSTRVYFADFYCVNKKKRPHYVTLVMTTVGSATDKFCKEHLVALNLENNPFFVIKKTSKRKYVVHVTKCSKLCVELLYTDVINIGHMLLKGASFQNVVSVGRHGGRKPKPKNIACTLCRLPTCITTPSEE
jgi:hypothetical protein